MVQALRSMVRRLGRALARPNALARGCVGPRAARPNLQGVLILLAAFASSATAEPLKIRVGWISVPVSLAPVLFARPELARNQGKSYVLEPIRFTGSSIMLTALATGNLDIAELSFSSFGFALQNAGLDDIRIIADTIQDGARDHLSVAFMVRKEGPVAAIADLRGRVLATNVIGTGTDIGMRAMLRKAGLEDKRDYSVVEADYTTMKPMLLSGKAELIATTPVTVHDPGLLAGARTLFSQRDAFGTTQLLSEVARREFIAKNRAALVDYLEDYLRALRWYLDPANRKEAVEIISKFTRLPAARLEGWVLTKDDFYRDPDGRPNLAALQANLKLQKEQGFLNADIDVARYADLSLIEEAGGRLK